MTAHISRADKLNMLLQSASFADAPRDTAASEHLLRELHEQRRREPLHVLVHGWALLHRPEALGEQGVISRSVENVPYFQGN